MFATLGCDTSHVTVDVTISRRVRSLCGWLDNPLFPPGFRCFADEITVRAVHDLESEKLRVRGLNTHRPAENISRCFGIVLDPGVARMMPKPATATATPCHIRSNGRLYLPLSLDRWPSVHKHPLSIPNHIKTKGVSSESPKALASHFIFHSSPSISVLVMSTQPQNIISYLPGGVPNTICPQVSTHFIIPEVFCSNVDP